MKIKFWISCLNIVSLLSALLFLGLFTTFGYVSDKDALKEFTGLGILLVVGVTSFFLKKSLVKKYQVEMKSDSIQPSSKWNKFYIVLLVIVLFFVAQIFLIPTLGELLYKFY